MRKPFAALLLGVAVLALAAPVDAGDRNFVAHLSGRDEVPSVSYTHLTLPTIYSV